VRSVNIQIYPNAENSMGKLSGRPELRTMKTYTVNPALLTSSFVWQILLSFFHISLFKVIKRKYFSQGNCEFLIFLFVLLDKIKIFTLETVYLPHQLLYMLFLAPLKNV
jgi:hypothetical protein